MAIAMTDAAKTRLREIFSAKPQAKALRVGLRGGGCSGYSYIFELDEGEATEQDKVFRFDELTLYVDKKSYFYLNGAELDFIDELMGKRFQFNNPNVASTCGCGESVAF
ncbi:MAG: iron-sulfur cluster assembly accessory protein [Deltaproteobacteria bacterium]|nr:iron-sulfur cluster assembly accessory protein [Deltaproteobacteria bacterium]